MKINKFLFAIIATSCFAANTLASNSPTPWSSATPNNFVYIFGLSCDKNLLELCVSNNANQPTDGVNIVWSNVNINCPDYPVVNGKIHVPAGSCTNCFISTGNNPYYAKLSADGSTGRGATGKYDVECLPPQN